MVPITVVPASLHIGNGFRENLSENWEKRENGRPGHELGDLVNALIDRLK